MRIALLDPPGYSPAYDHRLATALAARGHDVELLTSPFAHGQPPSPEGYRRREVFLALSGRLGRRVPLRRVLKAAEYAPSVARLLREVRRLQPDVVHVQWLPLLRRDLRWVERLPRPRVFTAHNVHRHSGETDPAERRELYAPFDAIVVHTASGVQQLGEWGVEAVRVPHGTFGVPPGPIEPPTGRRLLFFGLIRDYKGLDVLIRALAKVRDAQLVVAGDPMEPIEPVRQLARDLAVDDRIEWRLGYLPDGEIDELMHDTTIAVFPYRGRASASGPLATALGHGRPVVATDVLGEIVEEFGAGLVVPQEDPDALAGAINRLLDDPSEAFRGTERAREALSWESIAEAHERLYADLTASIAR